MKKPERRHRRSPVFIVNFVSFVEFEQMLAGK